MSENLVACCGVLWIVDRLKEKSWQVFFSDY